jgi:3-oxoacyl-[acyl-carrier protein] reductase
MELNGRIALVTGAGGGIGSAIVTALAQAGAHVIALDRNASALAKVDDNAEPVVADLSNPAEIGRTMQDMLARHGRIDVLVNNAGVLSPNKLAGTTLEEWHRLMAINLDAALLLTQAVIPAMKAKGWGRIVNIASYAWKSGGLTAGTGYSVSKAALVGLTYSTARELASSGVTANAIAPAYVVSPMIMEQLSEEERNRQLAAIPVGRLCEPEEVAHAVRFLASPLSGFMTGVVIDMNGGLQFG